MRVSPSLGSPVRKLFSGQQLLTRIFFSLGPGLQSATVSTSHQAHLMNSFSCSAWSHWNARRWLRSSQLKLPLATFPAMEEKSFVIHFFMRIHFLAPSHSLSPSPKYTLTLFPSFSPFSLLLSLSFLFLPRSFLSLSLSLPTVHFFSPVSLHLSNTSFLPRSSLSLVLEHERRYRTGRLPPAKFEPK